MYQIRAIVVDEEEGPSFQSIFTFGVNIKNISNGIHERNSINTILSRFVFDLLQSSIEINNGIRTQMHFPNIEICIRINEFDIVRFGRFFQIYRFDLNTDFINFERFNMRLRTDQYKYRILIIVLIGYKEDRPRFERILISSDLILTIYSIDQIDHLDIVLRSNFFKLLQSFGSIEAILSADIEILLTIERTIDEITEIDLGIIFHFITIRIIVVLIAECKRILIRFICRRFNTKLAENSSVHGHDVRRCTMHRIQCQSGSGFFHAIRFGFAICDIHHLLDSIMRIFIGAGSIPRIIRKIVPGTIITIARIAGKTIMRILDCFHTDHGDHSCRDACDGCIDLLLFRLRSNHKEIGIVNVSCNRSHSVKLSNEINRFGFMNHFGLCKLFHCL